MGGGYVASFIYCLIVLAAGYGLILGPWIYSDIKNKKNWPIRFHRQRREVAIAARTCDNSKKQQQYFYIPWEQLNASLLQSKNVATTGVTETFSLNLWFNDKASGKQIQAKFDLGSAALVLGLWESIRAFMEKGPEYCPMDWYSRQNKDKSLMAMTLRGISGTCSALQEKIHEKQADILGILLRLPLQTMVPGWHDSLPLK